MQSHSIRDSRPSQLQLHYHHQGYLIIKGLIEDQHHLEQLRASADQVTHQTRHSDWQFKRTVGKQFPPWTDDCQDVWGVQHIMHPQLSQTSFLELYFSPLLLSLVSNLMGTQQTMMGLHNLLVEPLERSFGLDWHRDSIKASVNEEDEKALLDDHLNSHPGIQWNLALYPDECLFIVPGSHRRTRTPEERAVDGTSEEMPGSVRVRLEPGDAVFYDAQILHRATYVAKTKRRTLHGAHLDPRSSINRGGGIVQHFDRIGFYFAEADFWKSLNGLQSKEKAQEMVQCFMKWCEDVKGAKFDGYVQDNV